MNGVFNTMLYYILSQFSSSIYKTLPYIQYKAASWPQYTHCAQWKIKCVPSPLPPWYVTYYAHRLLLFDFRLVNWTEVHNYVPPSDVLEITYDASVEITIYDPDVFTNTGQYVVHDSGHLNATVVVGWPCLHPLIAFFLQYRNALTPMQILRSKKLEITPSVLKRCGNLRHIFLYKLFKFVNNVKGDEVTLPSIAGYALSIAAGTQYKTF